MASILKVDTIQDQSGNNIINESADTITIGASGDTITVPTGASLTVPNGGLSGQNYPAFRAYVNGTTTISDNVFTKIQFNTEVYDTDNTYDPTTNYRFTPNVAGKYFVYSSLVVESDTTRRIEYVWYTIYKNGNEIYRVNPVYSADNISWSTTGVIANTVEMNGTTDYLEMYVLGKVFSGSPQYLGNVTSYSTFGAYRIGS